MFSLLHRSVRKLSKESFTSCRQMQYIENFAKKKSLGALNLNLPSPRLVSWLLDESRVARISSLGAYSIEITEN